MSDKLVIILGMHRSGTSMLTKISNFLGLRLEIGEFVPAIENDNDKGFWELQEVVDINESILDNFGITHLDSKELPSNWLDDLEKSKESDKYIKKIEDILKRTNETKNKSNIFGIKDPRICRLLPLWIKCCQNLNIEPVFIFAIRNPIEVAKSLHKRNNISMDQGLDLWKIYNQEAELYSRGFKRYFVSFPDIMNSWERDLLEAQDYLGIGWYYNGDSLDNVRENINKFIQRDLYRNKTKDTDIEIANDIEIIYNELYTKSLIQESVQNMNSGRKNSVKKVEKTTIDSVDSNNNNRKICIATPDIIGPTRNGGIGTAYYNMATFLSKAGFDVTILYLLGDYEDNNVKSIDNWIEYYKNLNIKFTPLEIDSQANNIKISQLAYKWLKNKDFDIIHFPDWLGLAYYSTIAKRTGTDFANTTICIGLHSPTKWHNQFNDHKELSLINKIDQNHTDFIEEQAVSLADIAISPSQYLVDWYKESNQTITPNIKVIQNISSSLSDDIDYEVKEILGADIKEIVFFGRLEIRKGVNIFCDAIKSLTDIQKKQINFTFLGKISEINSNSSDKYIKEKLIDSSINYKIIDNLHSDEAIKYLSGYGRVAVIASLMENSPYVLMEVISSNIPFISSNTGGMIELINEDYSKLNCFSPNKSDLLEKLTYILSNKATSAKLKIKSNDTKNDWLDFHKNKDSITNINFDNNIAEHEINQLVDFIGDISDNVSKLSNDYLEISGNVNHQKNIIEQHNQTIKDRNTEIRKLNENISNLNIEIQKYKESINYYKNELSEAADKNEEQKNAYENTIHEHKNIYENMVNSSSWKITKPLRTISSKLKDRN